MLDYSHLSFYVEAMTPQDVTAIMEIEQVSFSAPWSARAYDYELHYNELAHYYVVRTQTQTQEPQDASPPSFWRRLIKRVKRHPSNNRGSQGLVGYGGFWLMVDEAHISTIATHPAWRRHGIGEILLLAMIDAATAIGARWVTLEVRASNLGAQALYRKYGFAVTGERKNYYSDNGEDALIMATPLITTADYRNKLAELKDALFARLSH